MEPKDGGLDDDETLQWFCWFGNHLPFTFMNQASNLRTGYRASFGARFGVESQIQLGRGESKLLGYGGVIHIFFGGRGWLA